MQVQSLQPLFRRANLNYQDQRYAKAALQLTHLHLVFSCRACHIEVYLLACGSYAESFKVPCKSLTVQERSLASVKVSSFKGTAEKLSLKGSPILNPLPNETSDMSGCI